MCRYPWKPTRKRNGFNITFKSFPPPSVFYLFKTYFKRYFKGYCKNNFQSLEKTTNLTSKSFLWPPSPIFWQIVSHPDSRSYKVKVTCPKNLDVRLRRCAGFHESQPGKELTSVSHSNLSPSPRSICLKHISKDIAKDISKDISKDIAKTIIKSWKRTDFNIILKSLHLPPLHRF